MTNMSICRAEQVTKLQVIKETDMPKIILLSVTQWASASLNKESVLLAKVVPLGPCSRNNKPVMIRKLRLRDISQDTHGYQLGLQTQVCFLNLALLLWYPVCSGGG